MREISQPQLVRCLAVGVREGAGLGGQGQAKATDIGVGGRDRGRIWVEEGVH